MHFTAKLIINQYDGLGIDDDDDVMPLQWTSSTIYKQPILNVL